MSAKFLMLMDTPVLEISDNYSLNILNKALLPISLRFDKVSYDDIYHGWAESRHMNIARTNAKNILNSLRLSQNNQYRITEALHFATLSDSYWIKNADENISWEEVSLFRQPQNKDISEVALCGGTKLVEGKIHTPEPSVLGMSAKTWKADNDGRLWLYKISRKEAAASKIFDLLQIKHVPYIKAEEKELFEITSPERLEKIRKSGEIVVKCPIISSEAKSIFSFEDYQVFCEGNGYPDNYAYSSVEEKFADDYYAMQIADFIISNEDRHIGNWGFFMDNQSGEILSLHPLFDHDHAFSGEKDIPCQTGFNPETLRQSAISALQKTGRKPDLESLTKSEKPEELTDAEWERVIRNAGFLL